MSLQIPMLKFSPPRSWYLEMETSMWPDNPHTASWMSPRKTPAPASTIYLVEEIVPTCLRIYLCFDLEGLSTLETMTVLLFTRHPVSETVFPWSFLPYLVMTWFFKLKRPLIQCCPTRGCFSGCEIFHCTQHTLGEWDSFAALMNMVMTGLTSGLKVRCRKIGFLTHRISVSSSIFVCLFVSTMTRTGYNRQCCWRHGGF